MRSQHKIIALALGTVFATIACGTAMAQDAGPYASRDAGPFVGVGVGNAHWNAPGWSQANRLDYSLFGGQRWNIGSNQSLGWRAAATDFGQPTLATPYGTTVDTRLRALGFGADYRLRPSAGPVFLEANAGLVHGVARAQVPGLGGASTKANGYDVGARVGYTLASNLDISLGYDYNRLHLNGFDNHLNLGTVNAQAAWHF